MSVSTECTAALLQSLDTLICIYCYFLQTQVFAGNDDRDSIVRHYPNPPIRARYIRFQPTAWNNHISMRVGLNGC